MIRDSIHLLVIVIEVIILCINRATHRLWIYIFRFDSNYFFSEEYGILLKTINHWENNNGLPLKQNFLLQKGKQSLECGDSYSMSDKQILNTIGFVIFLSAGSWRVIFSHTSTSMEHQKSLTLGFVTMIWSTIMRLTP